MATVVSTMYSTSRSTEIYAYKAVQWTEVELHNAKDTSYGRREADMPPDDWTDIGKV
jgi:hypothetical protein